MAGEIVGKGFSPTAGLNSSPPKPSKQSPKYSQTLGAF